MARQRSSKIVGDFIEVHNAEGKGFPVMIRLDHISCICKTTDNGSARFYFDDNEETCIDTCESYEEVRDCIYGIVRREDIILQKKKGRK